MTQNANIIDSVEEQKALMDKITAENKKKTLEAIEDPSMRAAYATLLQKSDELGDALTTVLQQNMQSNAATSVLWDEKYEDRQEKLHELVHQVLNSNSNIYKFVEEQSYTDAQIEEKKAEKKALKAVEKHSTFKFATSLSAIATFGFALTSALQVIAPKLDEKPQENLITFSEARDKTPISSGLAVVFATSTLLAGTGALNSKGQKNKAVKEWKAKSIL